MRLLSPLLPLLLLGCIEDTRQPPLADGEGDAQPSAATDGQAEARDAAPPPDALVAPPLDAHSDGDGAFDAAAPPLDGDRRSACPATCRRVTECLLETCEALGSASRDRISALCLEECTDNPSFVVVAAGIDACEALGEYFLASHPDHGLDCGGEPACQAYGARVAECLAEICAPAEAISDVVAATFEAYCDDAVTQGRARREDVITLAREGCDSAFMADTVRALTQDDPAEPDDGSLARFCAEGPLQRPADCQAACEVLGRCLPEDDPNTRFLRDPDGCQYACLATEGIPPGWACVAQSPRCEAVGPCFTPPDVEACGAYGAKLAGCLTDACPPLAPVEAGLARPLRESCDDALFRGARDIAEIDRLLEEAIECTDPPFDALVSDLVDGDLAGICADGLPRPVPRCEAACDRLTPCLQDTPNALGERDFCLFMCALALPDVSEAQWRCVEDALPQDCPGVFECFG